jgi:hypothetical protein
MQYNSYIHSHHQQSMSFIPTLYKIKRKKNKIYIHAYPHYPLPKPILGVANIVDWYGPTSKYF